jgi:hypothetical protein
MLSDFNQNRNLSGSSHSVVDDAKPLFAVLLPKHRTRRTRIENVLLAQYINCCSPGRLCPVDRDLNLAKLAIYHWRHQETNYVTIPGNVTYEEVGVVENKIDFFRWPVRIVAGTLAVLAAGVHVSSQFILGCAGISFGRTRLLAPHSSFNSYRLDVRATWDVQSVLQ